jgi:hypothetical protein
LGFLSSLLSALATVCAWAAGHWGGYGHFPLLIQGLTQTSTAIDFVCGYLIDLLLWLTRFLGALPFSYLYLARPEAAAVVFYYLALVVAFILGLSRPGRGAGLALGAGLLLTMQAFFMSSCMEVLVTAEKVVVVRPWEPPLLLVLPQYPDAGLSGDRHQGRERGYLPAFHRDFVGAYLRSLSGRGDCTTSIVKARSQPATPFRPADRPVAALDLLCHLQSVASLRLKDTGPEVVSALPAAAVAVEEAQGVKLYKFRTWGLGVLVAERIWTTALSLLWRPPRGP